jgi:hypothetical protein
MNVAQPAFRTSAVDFSLLSVTNLPQKDQEQMTTMLQTLTDVMRLIESL